MFEPGTTVKNEHSVNRGKVLFGPFESVATYIHGDAYLVELLEGEFKGKVAIWTDDETTIVAKFEAGQRITFKYSSEEYEVVSGPYPEEGDLFWVYKNENGDHSISYEKHMVPVVE